MPTLYRIVKTNPPTVSDFVSRNALGLPIPSDPVLARVSNGISVHDSTEGSRRLHARHPRLGAFIAELSLPDDERIRIEKTLRDPAHYTVWAEPERLLESVVRVLPA